MEFKRVCRLPFTAIAMLLQLLQLIHLPGNRIPRSVYAFKKFFQSTTVPTKQRFCPSWKTKLEQKQQRCQNVACANLEPNSLVKVPPKRAFHRTVASGPYMCTYMCVGGHMYIPTFCNYDEFQESNCIRQGWLVCMATHPPPINCWPGSSVLSKVIRRYTTAERLTTLLMNTRPIHSWRSWSGKVCGEQHDLSCCTDIYI